MITRMEEVQQLEVQRVWGFVAKRFTDTEKWKKAWFRMLPAKVKLAWGYVLDNCDHAGIWSLDFELMSFQIGEKIEQSDFEKACVGKFEVIDGDKYFFPSFVSFQYGELRDNNSTHVSVIKRLQGLGIDVEYHSGLSDRPSAVLARLSAKKKREVMAADYFRCTYCGEAGTEETLVVDHIVPRTQGGDNSDSNLTTACVSCNSRKADIPVGAFVERSGCRATLSPRLLEKVPMLKAPSNSLNAPAKELGGAKDKDKDTDKDLDTDTGKGGVGEKHALPDCEYCFNTGTVLMQRHKDGRQAQFRCQCGRPGDARHSPWHRGLLHTHDLMTFFGRTPPGGSQTGPAREAPS